MPWVLKPPGKRGRVSHAFAAGSYRKWKKPLASLEENSVTD